MKKLLLCFCLVATTVVAQSNNPILDSSNTSLSITNFRGSGTTNNLGGVPLGTVGGSTTGELGQKVLVIGGTLTSTVTGGATSANQTVVQATAAATAPANGLMMAGLSDDKLQFFRIASTNKDLNALTITTITTAWTPASGKKFRIMGGTISVSAAASVLFEDNTAGNTLFRTPKLAADTPYTFVVYGGQGRLSSAANNVLKMTASAAGAVTGTVYGTEE